MKKELVWFLIVYFAGAATPFLVAQLFVLLFDSCANNPTCGLY